MNANHPAHETTCCALCSTRVAPGAAHAVDAFEARWLRIATDALLCKACVRETREEVEAARVYDATESYRAQFRGRAFSPEFWDTLRAVEAESERPSDGFVSLAVA